MPRGEKMKTTIKTKILEILKCWDSNEKKGELFTVGQLKTKLELDYGVEIEKDELEKLIEGYSFVERKSSKKNVRIVYLTGEISIKKNFGIGKYGVDSFVFTGVKDE